LQVTGTATGKFTLSGRETLKKSVKLHTPGTSTQVDKMAEIQAEINELKAEIKEIKDNNRIWAGDAGVLAAIAAARQHIVALEARLAAGKFPIFTLHFNI
jgi:cell division protein FtsB